MDHFRQRIGFSAPTASDVLLDSDRKSELQDLITFFGRDDRGNVVMVCINQMYTIQQANSVIYVKDHSGLELIGEEMDNGSYGFSSWKTPSLRLQCIVPMQTWRIVYSGRCRNNRKQHHVKINFLWKPLGFPVYCDKKNIFFKHEINVGDSNFVKNLLGFDQFGQISGTIIIDGKTEMIKNMSAIKLRRWNMSTNDSVFASLTDSVICSIQKLERTGSSGHLKTITEHEMIKSKKIQFSFQTSFGPPTITIQHKNFNLSTNLKNSSPAIILNNVLCESIQGDDFNGLLLCFKDVLKCDIKDTPCEQITDTDLVNLGSELCAHSNLVGNKAKSLFQLKKAISLGQINDATVPDGICVTTFAMKNHIKENVDLSNSLNETIKKAKECSFEQLWDACERSRNQWLLSKISADLMVAISNDVHERRVYAVRSSGTFEDGEWTSSAGQYISKVGCTGRQDDIAAAVLECWSSNFSARAITYRNNNGQPLMSDMAVIIQDLVQTDRGVAGIAFTRDPNTGDPNKITIAATYGSGEGVASGSVDPDAVVVSRPQLPKFSVTHDDFATVLDPPASQRSETKGGSNAEPCISEDLSKKLANICVLVENVFGSAQDIEWASLEGRVYLLQSRPVTSIFAWSKDEISKEFDSPFTNEGVVMFYNVKETYPNPMLPLSVTLDIFSLYPWFNLKKTEVSDMYHNKLLHYSYYNQCVNVFQAFQDMEPNSVFTKLAEYSIAGKTFLTDDIWKKMLLKNKTTKPKILLRCLFTFKCTLFIESLLTEIRQLINNVTVKESDSALEHLCKLYTVITVLEKAGYCHMRASTNTVVSHTLLAILGHNFKKDSTPEFLSSLAATVKTPDTINGSILKDLQAIAGVISELPSKREFCDLPVENCSDWLKLHCEKGFSQVEEFIKKYGHRGVQELDFGSETWSTDPNRLFSCLQSLVSSDYQRFDEKLNIGTCRTDSMGCVKKKILNYLSKRYRKSISYREQSKDLLVQITHKLRMEYRKLGEELVEEEKIPDSKLVFFMSQYELSMICRVHCPDIVHKALKRRKIWPTLSTLQFDVVCRGLPIPVDSSNEEFVGRSTRLKGCCVYPGRVKSRACVLDRIGDAHNLRPGDILIVKTVDISWSPYFSIISGLVTEIGGIISHGAVVAREYGLPCLIGVVHVKKYFKTGDTVILDSEEGFVIKVN